MALLNNNYLLGLLCAITGALTFSLSLVLARVSYDHGTDAQTVLFVRFLLLGLMMLLWNRSRRIKMRLPAKLLTGNIILAFLYFIGIGSYLSSVSYLPVSFAVLIFYTYPILVALMTAAQNRSWPEMVEIAALIAAFIGLYIALDVETSGAQATGLILAVMAAIGVAANTVGSGILLHKMPTTVFSMYLAFTTMLCAGIVVLWQGHLSLPETTTGWWAFCGMLISFIVGFIAIYNGIRLLGSLRLSTIMNLEPVATIAIAVVLLNEVLTGKHLLGGLIVLMAILLAQWPQLRQHQQNKIRRTH
ncbi:MAG: DMT family transporter [Thiolinea sp.]